MHRCPFPFHAFPLPPSLPPSHHALPCSAYNVTQLVALGSIGLQTELGLSMNARKYSVSFDGSSKPVSAAAAAAAAAASHAAKFSALQRSCSSLDGSSGVGQVQP